VRPATRAKGIAELNLVVGKEGRVTQVSVGGNVANTPLAACIEKAVRAASFPRSAACASTTASTFASPRGTTDPASEYTKTHQTRSISVLAQNQYGIPAHC